MQSEEKNTHSPVTDIRRRPLSLLAMIILLGIIALIGFQSISAPLLLDDNEEFVNVHDNKHFAANFSPDFYGLFRPIKNLVFWSILQARDHLEKIGHIVSLFLYLLVTVLVFYWFRKLYPDGLWAVLGAAVWALAPTQVSALAWLSCSNILIALICLLGGVIIYDKARLLFQKGNNRAGLFLFFLCALLYIIAFFAYESMIVFPVLIILYDWFHNRQLKEKKSCLAYTIFFSFGLAAFVFRTILVGNAYLNNPGFSPISDWQVAFSSAFFIIDHIRIWMLPLHGPDILGTYIWGKSVSLTMLIVAWLFLIFLAGVAVRIRKEYKRISFGIFWFLVTFLPLSNLIPFRTGPFADYYLVIPSIGLSLIVIEIARLLYDQIKSKSPSSLMKQKIAIILLMLLIFWRLTLVGQTFNWSQAWNDRIGLFIRITQARNFAFRGQTNLARELMFNGRLDQAEYLAMQAHTDAPWYIVPVYLLGDINNRQGDPQAARDWFAKAIELDPEEIYPHIGLAYTLETLNDYKAAIKHYQFVLKNSKSAYRETAFLNLSQVHYNLKDYSLSMKLLEKAVVEFPKSRSLHYNLAIVYKTVGRLEDAKKQQQIVSELALQKKPLTN